MVRIATMTTKTSPFIEVIASITRIDKDFDLETGKGTDVEDIEVVAELDYDGEIYICQDLATVKEDWGVFRKGDKIVLNDYQKRAIIQDRVNALAEE